MPKMNVPVEQRPVVSVVYSADERKSAESKHLAMYFAGQLADLGCAVVHLVPLSADGIPARDLGKERVVFKPTWKGKKVEIPASDITFSHFDILGTSHVIIVTVNSSDTYMCVEKMKQELDPNRQFATACALFSLQRGVRNNETVKDAFTGRKDLATIEGIVGFGVVPDPKTKALVPTEADPTFALERLSKEKEKLGTGPCNLLENMGLFVNYRANLTIYAWGMLIWESAFGLNALTGGSMLDTLRDARCRAILASMFREGVAALDTASHGGGGWAPDLLLISPLLSPWLYEMMLCLPTIIFRLAAWAMNILPPSSLPSTVLLDIDEGRTTMISTSLGELCKTGKKYGVEMPVCDLILKQVTSLEPAAGQGRKQKKDKEFYLDLIEKEAVILDGLPPPIGSKEKDTRRRLRVGEKSHREFRGWVSKFLLWALAIFCLYVLFVHEHELEEELEFTAGHHDQGML